MQTSDSLKFMAFCCLFLTIMSGWIYKQVLIDSTLDVYNGIHPFVMRERSSVSDGNYIVLGFEHFLFHDYSQNTASNWIGFIILCLIVVTLYKLMKYYDRQAHIYHLRERESEHVNKML